MRGQGSIPTGGDILSLHFFGFHAVKTKMHEKRQANYLWGMEDGVLTMKILLLSTYQKNINIKVKIRLSAIVDAF